MSNVTSKLVTLPTDPLIGSPTDPVDRSVGLYTISVRPRSIGKAEIHFVSILKQVATGVPESQFTCGLQVNGLDNNMASIQVVDKPKFHRHSDVWNASNYIDIAKALLIYFMRTKHASSEKWTEAWYISTKKGLETYKMYDCSTTFIQGNANRFLHLIR